jgi:DNA-binding NtrC family response regulator
MAVTTAVRRESPGSEAVSVRAGVVLVADPDRSIATFVADALKAAGHETLVADDGQTVLDILGSRDVDVVLLDLNLPKVSGLNVLAALPSVSTDAEVIVMTDAGTVESAVEASIAS